MAFSLHSGDYFSPVSSYTAVCISATFTFLYTFIVDVYCISVCRFCVVAVVVDDVRLYLWTAVYCHPSRDIWLWRTTVAWYWQAELRDLEVNLFLCHPPQIPHGLTQARTRFSAVRSRRLTEWAMARPIGSVYLFAPQGSRSVGTYAYTSEDNIEM
jgi:hypothetical protein